MPSSNALVYSIAILLILAILAAILKKKPNSDKDQTVYKYKAKNLLTSNELEFINRLEQACPQYRFHAQVNMAALMEPVVARSDKSNYYRARGKIAQKMIDYAVQDRGTGRVVALIELDDKTHDVEKDTIRDILTASAGYKTIRWNSKNKPSIEEIRKELV